MECLGVEPGVAGWKAQMDPLSYGGTPWLHILLLKRSIDGEKKPFWASL